MTGPTCGGEQKVRLAAAYLRERFEARYAVQLEIEVSGINRKHDLFHERTVTRDISSWGCSFVLSVALRPNDLVRLQLAKADEHGNPAPQRALFQVVRVRRERRGWLVAAWKLEDHDLWGAALGDTTQDRSAVKPLSKRGTRRRRRSKKR